MTRQRPPKKRFWALPIVTLILAPGAFADESEVAEVVPLSASGELVESATAPDYAEVAADARKIAEEIEERLIETHMRQARDKLSEADARKGHPKAEEAFLDMKEMIQFCESTAGGAGSACKFKLKIQMSVEAGNTMDQLSKGMNPGMSGQFGQFGQGQGGQAGGQTPFALYGPEQFGGEPKKSDRLGKKKKKTNAKASPHELDGLAADVDELGAQKKFDLDFSAETEVPIMEEYRGLIEAYFKRIAEEE